MKNLRNKGLISLLGIFFVALSVLGVAYADWTDKLVFNGWAKTGELNVVWDPNYSYQVYVWNASSQQWVPEPENKNYINVTMTTNNCTNNCDESKHGCKVMTVNIEGAYPETKIVLHLKIHNIGTIAAHWTGITPVPGSFTVNGVVTNYTTLANSGWMAICVDPYPDPYIQIHPCNTVNVTVTIIFHNPLPECTTICGEFELNFIQWNL